MRNSSNSSLPPEACHYQGGFMLGISLIDMCSFVIGQPVFVRLMWFHFTSSKAADVLNFHLGLFHYLQNWMSMVHLILLHLHRLPHSELLEFLLVYAQVGGPMALSSICLERLVAVSYPTSYPLLRTYRFREVSVVLMWCISLFLATITVLPGNLLGRLRGDMVRLLPLLVLMCMSNMMVRCSISIARALRRAGPGGGHVHPGKKRAFKTVCATCSIVALCYGPVTVLQMMVTHYSDFDCLASPLCVFLLSVASIVHPLFYLSTQGRLLTCSRTGQKAP